MPGWAPRCSSLSPSEGDMRLQELESDLRCLCTGLVPSRACSPPLTCTDSWFSAASVQRAALSLLVGNPQLHVTSHQFVRLQ